MAEAAQAAVPMVTSIDEGQAVSAGTGAQLPLITPTMGAAGAVVTPAGRYTPSPHSIPDEKKEGENYEWVRVLRLRCFHRWKVVVKYTE